MTVLRIVRLGHPALRKPSSPVPMDELSTSSFQQFLDDLAETCIAGNGVGIAAPQVGVTSQVIVVHIDPNSPRYPNRTAFPLTIVVNPSVTTRSDARSEDWEGDLSAGIRGLVPRAAACTVEGLDRDGRRVGFKLSDAFQARVFQHEIDHLHGVFFLDLVERRETITELAEWERYWKPGARRLFTTQHDRARPLLATLTRELGAWASVLLVPDEDGIALHCTAHHNLPPDWAILENDLGSASMNARAYRSQAEVVANGVDEDHPSWSPGASRHRMTAVAVVPVAEAGTLEVLADQAGYEFDEARLEVMRAAAEDLRGLLAAAGPD